MAETEAEAGERERLQGAAEALAAAARAARAQASARGAGGGEAVNGRGAEAVVDGEGWLSRAWQSLWGMEPGGPGELRRRFR